MDFTQEDMLIKKKKRKQKQRKKLDRHWIRVLVDRTTRILTRKRKRFMKAVSYPNIKRMMKEIYERREQERVVGAIAVMFLLFVYLEMISIHFLVQRLDVVALILALSCVIWHSGLWQHGQDVRKVIDPILFVFLRLTLYLFIMYFIWFFFGDFFTDSPLNQWMEEEEMPYRMYTERGGPDIIFINGKPYIVVHSNDQECSSH